MTALRRECFDLLSLLRAWSADANVADSAKFLTEEERKEVVARLKLDRTSLADEYDRKFLKAALTDWKIWVHMLITIG